MKNTKQRIVMRGDTKYLEHRVERVQAIGFIDDVYTTQIGLEERTLTKKTINVYDIVTKTNVQIREQSFHFGKCFKESKWKRNSKIRFDGTVYHLQKCKGKNDQKLGAKEVWEIRNPRNVELIELETNNRHEQKKTRKRRQSKTKQRAREALKALERQDSVTNNY